MVNCNPETVSTDYDTSNRLYFQALRAPESVFAICRTGGAEGRLDPVRRPNTGSSSHGRSSKYQFIDPRDQFDAVDTAEDHQHFGKLLAELRAFASRPGASPLRSRGDRGPAPDRLPGAGAPVVRARWAPRCASDVPESRSSRHFTACAGRRSSIGSFKYAIEIDVDALCDGETTYVGADVLQHVKETGVHSRRLRLRAARTVARGRSLSGDLHDRRAAQGLRSEWWGS